MFAEFNWSEAMGTSPIFLVLVGCSIVTLGVTLERILYFWKRRGNPDGTLSQVLEKLRSGQVKEAAWACESSAHPVGTVASQLFRSDAQGGPSLDERLHISLSEQKLLLERNLGILGTMAAVAPLIGLLGTVWGIMRAFQDMARVGSAAPTVVAAGVAEALITTAAGLVIAVPAVMLYNHFARKMSVMLTVAENHTRTIHAALLDSGTRLSAHPRATDAREERIRREETPAAATLGSAESTPAG
jgi:biopolymer transport protein ExbB